VAKVEYEIVDIQDVVAYDLLNRPIDVMRIFYKIKGLDKGPWHIDIRKDKYSKEAVDEQITAAASVHASLFGLG
jgi:hypothetical protein